MKQQPSEAVQRSMTKKRSTDVNAGVFITFEGIEGAGKTTQTQKAYDLLNAIRPGEVVMTREPGGTSAGESIRDIMLRAGNERIDGMTEMLLVFAARRVHLREVIEPALNAGKIVLCDRFTDATFAYQGGGRNVDERLITVLQDMVQNALRPDLTLLLDIPVELGRTRIGARGQPDRLEAETISFFERVRGKYLELSRQYPERIHVIDATGAADKTATEIQAIFGACGLC